MASPTFSFNKGSYGHHVDGFGPATVAGVKELIATGHIFVEISGILVRDPAGKACMRIAQSGTDAAPFGGRSQGALALRWETADRLLM